MATTNDSTGHNATAETAPPPEYLDFSMALQNKLHDAMALLSGADSIVEAAIDGKNDPAALPYLLRIFDMLNAELNSSITLLDGSWRAYALKPKLTTAS